MPLTDYDDDMPDPVIIERDFRRTSDLEQSGLGSIVFYLVLGICVVLSLYLRVIGL